MVVKNNDEYEPDKKGKQLHRLIGNRRRKKHHSMFIVYKVMGNPSGVSTKTQRIYLEEESQDNHEEDSDYPTSAISNN